MPTNKNAQLRYQILDRCFSDYSHKYDIYDLQENVNANLSELSDTTVGIRQIRDDIRYMRSLTSYNAPIKAYQYDGKKCYYRYENEGFSIFNNELSVEDINKLRSTIDMLGKYRGAACNAWLEGVISNLEYRFGIKSNTNNAVSFEQNEQLKGLEHLSDLIECAINRIPLKILYCNYKGKEKTSTVHPYLLKQYNSRWFLFGLEENQKWGNRITNMALDRIVSYSHLADHTFIPNEDKGFSDLFKDIVGVTLPQDHPTPEKVILKFDNDRFPYVLSKPIHPSQQTISDTDHTISLLIRPNKEFESQILSYGNQVEIIEPEWLRRQISNKIMEIYKKYFPVNKDRTDTD